MQPFPWLVRLWFTYWVRTGEGNHVMTRSELIRRRRQMHRRIRAAVAERRVAVAVAPTDHHDSSGSARPTPRRDPETGASADQPAPQHVGAVADLR